MTQEIIVNDKGSDSQTVHIDENTTVDMKLFQGLYNELTGKTERLTRAFKDFHEIKFEDLHQLNMKIEQLCGQYNIIGRNTTVTVYHFDDSTERFSSFQRFAVSDRSSTSPCENIRIVYDFLILLPATKKPQPYKIEINLHSAAALRKRAMAEHGFSSSMVRIVAERTGYVRVEYVDYTVARTVLAAIDQWYEGLKKHKPSALLKFAQSRSNVLPLLFRLTTMSVILGACSWKADLIVPSSASLTRLFSAAIVTFGIVFLAGLIAGRLGVSCEQGIDVQQPPSGLVLNRGDENALQEANADNTKSARRALTSALLTLALKAVAGYLAVVLGIAS